MHRIRYVVRTGDTPRRIALQFGISFPALAAANPHWREEEPLFPGELLQIPSHSPRRYICKQGDTLSSLAALFRCSVDRLRECNPALEDNNEPGAGQPIEIPAACSESIVQAGAEYGPEQLARDLSLLKRSYPFISIDTIGRSVLGKPLHAVRIGEGPFRWHFNGACHANEWITSLILMRFLEDYASSCSRKISLGGKKAADLLQHTTLWIVPMLNPDGVELVQEGLSDSHPFYRELLAMNRGSTKFHGWKANTRGVDLNDQFPAGWEAERMRRHVSGPAPRDYGGHAPLCEPEAASIAEFTRRMDFHAVLSLHTQGEEIYWNYRDEEPMEAEEWAIRLGRSSGYRAVKLTESDAGYKDWFIHVFRRPGFTVEAGWGHNPLPLEAFPSVYDDMLKLLMEALSLGENKLSE